MMCKCKKLKLIGTAHHMSPPMELFKCEKCGEEIVEIS